ncbi:acyl-CoA dehydrogenase [Desulfitobacterium chlororespirans]|uniref:Acyl-CoA dehydrogenase n=1 Tax=Desulfitobacterium chlororespirans DSM 11544 TaxID=1121395 RepID=A0A1M7UZ89_9FIRM|nr:acyl-CoA dehydrogenase [Desulfitobacterium chlororespirans]SHN88289.1 Acyl-CoA dehydrogenase [Desulfitobacterium chlororespirans DSM 11544]
MDFKKTEEQELLLESLRELLTREMPESYLKECDEQHQYPTKLAKALVDNGFSLLGIPEEYGGTPADILTQILVIEEIAKAGGPFYLFTTAMQIDDMLTFGNEEQIRLTMEHAIKTGDAAFCLGITEPQAGSDDNAMLASATRKNGKVYLNGHKTFISGADRAPYILFFTRDVNAPNPHKAVSSWWVPMDAPGITIEPIHKVGTWVNSACDVYFNDVEVEEKDLVGKEGEGFMNLMKNFEIERLALMAGCLGWAECAFEDAARYANQRVQFGKPIGTYQLTQEKITNMYVKIENMRNMIYKSCWEKDNKISVQISSAMAKYYCAKACNEVIDDAVQIFGGIGYTSDHRVSRLWRDARVKRIGGGTDEIMIHILGRAILKQYK